MEDGTEKDVQITVGSGKAVSMAPRGRLEHVELQSPPNHKAWRVANGGRLKDLGSKKKHFTTMRAKGGQWDS